MAASRLRPASVRRRTACQIALFASPSGRSFATSLALVRNQSSAAPPVSEPFKASLNTVVMSNSPTLGNPTPAVKLATRSA